MSLDVGTFESAPRTLVNACEVCGERKPPVSAHWRGGHHQVFLLIARRVADGWVPWRGQPIWNALRRRSSGGVFISPNDMDGVPAPGVRVRGADDAIALDRASCVPFEGAPLPPEQEGYWRHATTSRSRQWRAGLFQARPVFWYPVGMLEDIAAFELGRCQPFYRALVLCSLEAYRRTRAGMPWWVAWQVSWAEHSAMARSGRPGARLPDAVVGLGPQAMAAMVERLGRQGVPVQRMFRGDPWLSVEV